MLEPNLEKKVNAQQMINDLKAKHAQEIMALVKKNVENREKAVGDIELRHNQEIQRVQEENREREASLLSECNVNYQARTQVLVIALLRIKSERDMALLTIASLAIGILGSIGLGGLVHEGISKVFMFLAIAGFIGTIILVGENLKRNCSYLERVKADTIQADLIWKEADYNRPSRFLIFGFISTVLLGLTLFMNPQAKIASNEQQPSTPIDTAQVATPAQPVIVPAPQVNPAPIASVLPKVIQISQSQAIVAPSKSGNHGIFTGGDYK